MILMARLIRLGRGPTLPILLPLILGLAPGGCDQPAASVPAATGPAAEAGPSPADSPAAKPQAKVKLLGDREAAYAGVVVKPTAPQDPSPFRFSEIAASAGIDFRHFSGMTEAKHFP